MGSHEIYPFHISISIHVVLIQVSFGQPYCWGIIGEASLPFLGDRISQSFPSPLAHTIFLPPLLWCFLNLQPFFFSKDPDCLNLVTSSGNLNPVQCVQSLAVLLLQERLVNRSRTISLIDGERREQRKNERLGLWVASHFTIYSVLSCLFVHIAFLICNPPGGEDTPKRQVVPLPLAIKQLKRVSSGISCWEKEKTEGALCQPE